MDPALPVEDPDAALDALLSELSEVSARHEPKTTESVPVPRVVRESDVPDRANAPSTTPSPPPSLTGGEPRVTVLRDVPRRRPRPMPVPPALRRAAQGESVTFPNDPVEAQPPRSAEPETPEPIPVMEVHEVVAEPEVDAPPVIEHKPKPVHHVPAPPEIAEPQIEEILLDDSRPFAAAEAFRREPPTVAVDPLGLGDPPFGLEPVAPPRRRWWLIPAVLLALVALAGQVLWFQFDRWSVDPQIRPVYASLCAPLGCELPPMRALDAFRTKDLVVRSHPDRPGALLVDAIIVNEAPFAQPFPELELRFSAIGGNLIAARRFSPREYLSGDAKGAKEIGARTPVHIALEIEDPGGDAVNYLITFR
jgi:hypothetical protein